jgi:hypothetical protein
VLDAGLAARVQAEYTSFLRNEEVYKGMGVPWKRGLMFLGVSTVPVADTEKGEENRGGEADVSLDLPSSLAFGPLFPLSSMASTILPLLPAPLIFGSRLGTARPSRSKLS